MCIPLISRCVPSYFATVCALACPSRDFGRRRCFLRLDLRHRVNNTTHSLRRDERKNIAINCLGKKRTRSTSSSDKSSRYGRFLSRSLLCRFFSANCSFLTHLCCSVLLFSDKFAKFGQTDPTTRVENQSLHANLYLAKLDK